MKDGVAGAAAFKPDAGVKGLQAAWCCALPPPVILLPLSLLL